MKHLDGTSCTVYDCEKCALDWFLTGNVYLVADDDQQLTDAQG